MSVQNSGQLPHLGQYDKGDGAPRAASSPWPRTTSFRGGSSKQKKLPRPTLETGISDADWSFFVSQWERYKRSTKILGQEAVDQLWACASEEMAKLNENISNIIIIINLF